MVYLAAAQIFAYVTFYIFGRAQLVMHQHAGGDNVQENARSTYLGQAADDAVVTTQAVITEAAAHNMLYSWREECPELWQLSNWGQEVQTLVPERHHVEVPLAYPIWKSLSQAHHLESHLSGSGDHRQQGAGCQGRQGLEEGGGQEEDQKDQDVSHLPPA